jgi:hypothetical protein
MVEHGLSPRISRVNGLLQPLGEHSEEHKVRAKLLQRVRLVLLGLSDLNAVYGDMFYDGHVFDGLLNAYEKCTGTTSAGPTVRLWNRRPSQGAWLQLEQDVSQQVSEILAYLVQFAL